MDEIITVGVGLDGGREERERYDRGSAMGAGWNCVCTKVLGSL